MTVKRGLLAAMTLFGVLLVAVPVSARIGEPNQVAPRDTPVRAHGKLSDAKRKVCESRLNAIKTIMSRASAAGEKHVGTFSGIQVKVEAFYTAKKLQIMQYESLKATATIKYDAAKAAVATVKQAPEVNCASENPVGTADDFKAKVKAMHDALKDYRSAVHALLVSVKSAAAASDGARQ